MSCFKIAYGSGCFYHITSPANLRIAEKIAHRVGITFVKKPVNIVAITAFAPASPTFKDMGMTAILVLDLGFFFEERINR